MGEHQRSASALSLPDAGSRGQGNAESRKSRRKSQGSAKGVSGSTKELSIEERLDLQLEQIMRSKSKLAIAMERVSADMHIKKRDREIVRLRKEVAEYTHTIHKQKEALTTQEASYNELHQNIKELKKRNLKLLQKQRHYDDMKRQLAMELPEESTEQMAARIKKEVMAKMERTLYDL